jgi:RNA polymerase-interacting CarD/CdnL/TRCF family regulator
MAQSFEIGDLAVYPAHGVVEVLVVTRSEVNDVFAVLRDTEVTVDEQTANRRYRMGMGGRR